MRESENQSRSGRGVWTGGDRRGLGAALTGRAAPHGQGPGPTDVARRRALAWGGWRERRDAWRPEEDRLAAAMRADPVPSVPADTRLRRRTTGGTSRGGGALLGAATTDERGTSTSRPAAPSAGVEKNDGRPTIRRIRRTSSRCAGQRRRFRRRIRQGSTTSSPQGKLAAEQNDYTRPTSAGSTSTPRGGAHRNLRTRRIELSKGAPVQVYVYFARSGGGIRRRTQRRRSPLVRLPVLRG